MTKNTAAGLLRVGNEKQISEKDYVYYCQVCGKDNEKCGRKCEHCGAWETVTYYIKNTKEKELKK
jgi:predicted ATP-dependent serine protease